MCATHKLFPTDMDPCDDKETQDMIKKYKVAPCPKRYPHDWSSCTYYHPREKARRRDPRKHQYTGIACPSMRQFRRCELGDSCPFSHNVFEFWLHPSRFRTQLCNDGGHCQRKLCFFAHRQAVAGWQACSGRLPPTHWPCAALYQFVARSARADLSDASLCRLLPCPPPDAASSS
jgi:hypothetical protein